MTKPFITDKNMIMDIAKYNEDDDKISHNPKLIAEKNYKVTAVVDQMVSSQESLIIQSASILEKVKAMVGTSQLTLVYRGTRDGFGFDKFHSLCDNKAPTFAIIKSDKNKIFGGFTDIHFKGEGGGTNMNGRSYLFSIRDDDSIVKIAHKQMNEVGHRRFTLVNYINSLYIYE